MATLTVDLAAIEANWRDLGARHGAPVAGVLKADAYGLGAAAVGARLFAAGVRQFFVAYPQEGAALRPHVGDAGIGILNGFFADHAALYVDFALAPVLGHGAEVAAFAAFARARWASLPAHLHIDSGMNRLGLDAAEVGAILPLLSAFAPGYVMTHLANAEDPQDGRNLAQAARFAAACAALPGWRRSIANSSGVFLGADFASDLARPGAAIYGINPTPGAPNPMRPSLRLSARVLQLREIGAGAAVGYNAIWVADRPTRVATVSVGYADGYMRALSNKAFGVFDGTRLPLIGRVSMDLTTFDVTARPDLRVGDELELMGPAVPPDQLARWAGTNGYEILTSLKPRGGRVYAPVGAVA